MHVLASQEVESYGEAGPGAGGRPGGQGEGEGLHDCILLGACGGHEVLPQSPELPADIFTACLTTPIRVCPHYLPMLQSKGA